MNISKHTGTRVAVAALAAAVVASGCGSSKSSGGSGGSKGTFTVGIITDITGPAASGNKTCPQGVQAGAVEAAKSGYTIKYVVGDSQTSPSAVETAAKRLVEQDHVLAMILCSGLAFGATDYLHSVSMPVVGEAEDGPEWQHLDNMFSITGALDFNAVSDGLGRFFKMQGATTIGALGYGISPSSSNAAKGAGVSAQAVGLKVGYINSNFPYGSTNVEPEALAMKAHGVDGVTSETDPNTSFALITALRQAGANIKVAAVPDGYGGDLAQAGPGAIAAGQGVFFTTQYQPVEMHTQATETFQADLRQAGVSGLPTFAEYNGYASVGLLVDALKLVSGKVTQSSLMTALNKVTGFDAWGLLGSHTITPANRQAYPIGPDGCGYWTKLSGTNFDLVPGADPLCGRLLPTRL